MLRVLFALSALLRPVLAGLLGGGHSDRTRRRPGPVVPAAQLKRHYPVPRLDAFPEPRLDYFAPDAEVVRARPPAGERLPGTHVFSYISDHPGERVVDQRMPNLHERPFVHVVAQ